MNLFLEFAIIGCGVACMVCFLGMLASNVMGAKDLLVDGSRNKNRITSLRYRWFGGFLVFVLLLMTAAWLRQ